MQAEAEPDDLLLDLVRSLGCYSVKRGCETANCGLCTVWLDGKPVLSCSILAVRADGRHVTTLEGLQKEAEEFGMFLAAEGGEQCGFCSPGFIMNVLAMERELKTRMRRPSRSIWPATCAAAADICPSCGQLRNIWNRNRRCERMGYTEIRHLTGHAAHAPVRMVHAAAYAAHAAAKAVHMPEEITVW